MRKWNAIAALCLLSSVSTLHGEIDSNKLHKQYEENVRTASRYPFRKFEKAVEANDLLAVRRLLGKGLPVSLQIPESQENWEGIPPSSQALHLAAARDHLDMVKLLLDRGANPNARTSWGATPLSSTSNLRIAQLLIARGANVSARDEVGSQAIHRAASSTGLDLVKLLVRHGADPLARDKRGCQPIHEAAQSGTIEIMRYLLSRAARVDATIADRDEYFRNGWQPLHFAAQRENIPDSIALATLLLDKGAAVNAATSDGETPLHLATGQAMTRLLLAKGAKVDAGTRMLREQPLHTAARDGDTGKIRQLLDHGADVHAKRYDAATPLDVATFFIQMAAVDYLLTHGAKASALTLEQARRIENHALIRKISFALHGGRKAGPPVHRR